MKRITTLIICALIFATSVFAQSDSLFKVYQEHFSKIEQSLKNVKVENRVLKQRIKVQEEKAKIQDTALDSLKFVVISNTENIKTTAEQLKVKINRTKASLQTKANVTELEEKTTWGIFLLVLLLIASFMFYGSLHKRIRAGNSSIHEVQKAQDALQAAQTKMQEESVKLDNKLIELFEKQMPSTFNTPSTQIDHSLTLKVADEIVRIEMNLSRMDSSVKGYKQLSKAVQRIKDNFNANGYEIVDMLGKPYNAGMKVIANFVLDDSLSSGSQVITGIIKPQINYNGQMIQAAQITVSQNI